MVVPVRDPKLAPIKHLPVLSLVKTGKVRILLCTVVSQENNGHSYFSPLPCARIEMTRLVKKAGIKLTLECSVLH